MKDQFAEVRNFDIKIDPENGDYICNYIKFGGGLGQLRTRYVDFLGFGFVSKRRNMLLRDIALGYLSGFPWHAILWYVLTRSMVSRKTRNRIIDWEVKRHPGREGGWGYERVDGISLYDLRQPPWEGK